MISLVDPETLQYVLRPTVYVPFGERNDPRLGSRDSVGASANRLPSLDESAPMMQPETLRARIR